MVLRGYPEDPAGPFSREERGSRNLRGTDIIFTSFFLNVDLKVLKFHIVIKHNIIVLGQKLANETCLTVTIPFKNCSPAIKSQNTGFLPRNLETDKVITIHCNKNND